ncbi:MAG: hypothetical protein WDO68_27575 [Gammaproteobacteria bacterium]
MRASIPPIVPEQSTTGEFGRSCASNLSRYVVARFSDSAPGTDAVILSSSGLSKVGRNTKPAVTVSAVSDVRFRLPWVVRSWLAAKLPAGWRAGS